MMNDNKLSIVDEINNKRIIFWGTGRIALDFYMKYCKENSIIKSPEFWCDNNLSRQGEMLHGIEIISPETLLAMAEEEYLKNNSIAIVIAATGINLLQIVSQLEKNGFKGKLYSAVNIQAQIYFSNNEKKINEIINMYADEKSRGIYLSLIENMKKGRCIDFSLSDENQYFANDVIGSFRDDDIIVDAGVCNGEEIDRALCMNNNVVIHAFEPDSFSFEKLERKYSGINNVILHKSALWDKNDTIVFNENLLAPSTSVIANNDYKVNRCLAGRHKVKAIPLDDVIETKVTFIKMDIEGAEYNALKGSEAIIKKYKPRLAICVYHNITDYIEIPLLIKSMNPDYKFYFRQHSVTSGESVFYAI